MTDEIPDITPAPKRKGRPPSSSTSTRSGARPSNAQKTAETVNSALATMECVYSAMSLGTLSLNKPLTAQMIATSSEQWQAGNRQAFESSPKLASTIANIGQASGIISFLLTNVVAVGMVLRTFAQEDALQVEARNAQESPEN